MRSFPNIEKLAGKEHYTGYSGGMVWRVPRGVQGAGGRQSRSLSLAHYPRSQR